MTNGKQVRKNYILPAFYIIAFLVTLFIISTDQNLKTDFGSVKPYFIHWYILAATGVVDIIVAIVILARNNKTTQTLSWMWALLMILIMVGDILTYKSVGFTTPSQFAQYLFGITKYPQTLNYIPGLYDVLFLVYIILLSVGIAASRKK